MHNLDENWGNLIYLLVLLSFLLFGASNRKSFPLKKVAKYSIYWLLLILFFISLYSYRFEFSSFKNRILGELNPSRIQSTKGQLSINIARDGHFYINLKINNQPIKFMVDTGASDIVISINDARKIGINIENLNFNKIYQTANGKSFGASITLDKVEIGNIILNDIEASVNKGDMGTPLLGMRFLRLFTKYEFYQDRLILTL